MQALPGLSLHLGCLNAGREHGVLGRIKVKTLGSSRAQPESSLLSPLNVAPAGTVSLTLALQASVDSWEIQAH